MKYTHASLALAALTATFSLSTAAQSASLHIAPVSLRLDPGQQAAGITLTNPSNHPLVAQVRVLAWSQNLSDDPLSAQQDVVASPPIVTIPPHEEQLVRVVRLDHTSPRTELTYRLLIDELPDPEATTGDGAVDIRIRYSVPVFVIPAATTAGPRLNWQITEHGGGFFLKVANSGGLHAQLSAVHLLQADGTNVSVSEGLLGYALAGGAREWRLPVQGFASSQDVRFTAQVNGNLVEARASMPVTVANQ